MIDKEQEEVKKIPENIERKPRISIYPVFILNMIFLILSLIATVCAITFFIVWGSFFGIILPDSGFELAKEFFGSPLFIIVLGFVLIVISSLLSFLRVEKYKSNKTTQENKDTKNRKLTRLSIEIILTLAGVVLMIFSFVFAKNLEMDVW